MKILQKISFWIGLYIYIYNPIIKPLGFGAIKVLLLISIIFFLISYKRIFTFFKLFSKEMLLLFSLLIYIYILQFWGKDVSYQNAYIHIVWFLEGFLIPLFFISVSSKQDTVEIWKSRIIKVGIVASLITLFLILNPPFNEFLKQNIIIDAFELADKGKFITFRSFAFAEGSTFPYGIIQGLVIALCLPRLKNSPILILALLSLIVSILFNARIGLAPVFIGILLVILFGKLQFKMILYFLTIFFVSIWFLTSSDFATNHSESLKWGLGAIDQGLAFVSGKDGGTLSTITDEMVFFPSDDISLLFGEGRDLFIYQFDIQNRSDVGFVRQIYFGGIFFLGLMLLYLFYIVKRYIKFSHDYYFGILFLLTVLVCNQKGYMLFVSTGVFRVFTLIYVAAVFKHYENLKLNKDYLNKYETII